MHRADVAVFSVAALLLCLSPLSHAQANNDAFPTLSTASASAAAATSGAYDGLTNAPTVTNPYAVPTYPAPSVPPTAEAPFMQRSKYPQGMVFICFGAGLGFMIVCVLLWHAWVAWSIRRSMRRVQKGYTSLGREGPRYQPGLVDRGVQILKKSNPFYSQPDSDSMISMSLLCNEEQRAAIAGSNPGHGYPPDKKSLFFSPTASYGLPSAGLSARTSTAYMPSGYYAAGGPNRPTVQFNAQEEHPINPMSDSDYMGRDFVEGTSRGPGRGQSPGLAQRLLAGQQSTAIRSTNLEGRAPSTYLEDMFVTRPLSQEGLGRL